MSEYVIRANKLTKYFKRKCVINSLDLAIPKGCVYALLGRNGAGKTTTIRMLLGFLAPTHGSSEIFGCDSMLLPDEIKAKIGYVSEGHPVYGWMQIKHYEKYQSRFYAKWNHKLYCSIIDHFGIDDTAKAKELSRGQRAGFCLALTLASEPELLILDDPALGLDPVARRSFLEALVYITDGKERTILFSSHILSDVERVADRVAVIENGRLKADSSLTDFRQRVAKIVLRADSKSIDLQAIPGLLQSHQSNDETELVIANYTESVEGKIKTFYTGQIEQVPISLEDAFIAYLNDRNKENVLSDSLGEL